MPRKRLTELFPFLLPLRTKQKIACFYWKMAHDKNKYASEIQRELLPFEIFSVTDVLVNQNSGYDIQYQYNKVHNLKVCTGQFSGIVIHPGEVFSFWQLARGADRHNPYKDGLGLHDNVIVPVHGGGLCLLSELLYWTFLHSPLSVIEKHPHLVISLPSASDTMPAGIDATIQEGWSDLKVKNETKADYQVVFSFTEDSMTCALRSSESKSMQYAIEGKNLYYYRENNKIYRSQEIWRTAFSETGSEIEMLYTSTARITYKMPSHIEIEEGKRG